MLAYDLHGDGSLRLDDSLVRPDDVIGRVSGLNLEENELVLVFVDEFQLARSLALFFAFLERDSVWRVHCHLLGPRCGGSS